MPVAGPRPLPVPPALSAGTASDSQAAYGDRGAALPSPPARHPLASPSLSPFGAPPQNAYEAWLSRSMGTNDAAGGPGARMDPSTPKPTRPTQPPRRSTFFAPRGSATVRGQDDAAYFAAAARGDETFDLEAGGELAFKLPVLDVREKAKASLPPGAMPPAQHHTALNSPRPRYPPYNPSAGGDLRSNGAAMSASQPQQTGAAVAPGTKMPLGNASNIMVHAGFWNILSAAASATGSRIGSSFFPPGQSSPASSPYGDKGASRGTTMPVTTTTATQQQQPRASPPLRGPPHASNNGFKKKRISVDMIGRPAQFQHLVHASDAGQASAILRQWRSDNLGKCAPGPEWAIPIKEATRARMVAPAVAEVTANRADADPAPLRVANCNEGEPVGSLAITERHVDERDEHDFSDSDTIICPGDGDGNIDGLPGAGTIDPLSHAIDISETTDATHIAVESAPTKNGDRPFRPSVETLEKVGNVKILLELRYFAILKRPRDRDQRRAQLERELVQLTHLSDSDKARVRAAWAQAESEHLRERRTRVNPAGFQRLKVIGHGAFGVVSLVRERPSGELYAMKQLRKGDMLKKGQEGHVRAERDLLASASTLSRWIVRLVYSFQDVDHLYLVMEFMNGGDLLNLLIERDVLPEETAKFYFAEMILGIEETHRLGYIHRDIKPDNFLFDKSGHLKVSDFGLASDLHWAHDGAYFEQQRRELLRKHGIDLDDGATIGRKRKGKLDPNLDPETAQSVLTWREQNRRILAYSCVGTSNYFAVEVLRGLGYDQSCDWWSCGVILFEMLYGFPPFVSKTRHQTRQKILQWRTSLKFPSRPKVSREAQDLICKLICEREDRLGSGRSVSSSRPNSAILQQRVAPGGGNGMDSARAMMHGAEEIKAHPWFRGIDFNTIHLQEAPFVPDLRDPTDTRYFEDDIEDAPLPAPEIAPGVPAPDVAKDPILRDKVHGAHLLDVRKQMAFQGWTFRRPKKQVYDPRVGVLNVPKPKNYLPPINGADDVRGRSLVRSSSGSSHIRSLSV